MNGKQHIYKPRNYHPRIKVNLEAQAPNSSFSASYESSTSTNESAHPPLHRALVAPSTPENLVTIQSLLKQGAELDAAGPYKRTALQVALLKTDLANPDMDYNVPIHNRIETIELLLEAGADMDDFQKNLLIHSVQRIGKCEQEGIDPAPEEALIDKLRKLVDKHSIMMI